MMRPIIYPRIWISRGTILDTDNKFLWKFNKKRIKETIKEFELKKKFSIFYFNFSKVGAKDVAGDHILCENRHFIRVSSDIGYWRDANRIILHELCHAIQAEKYDSEEDFLRAYEEAGGNLVTGKSYFSNEFECEANEFAFKNKEILLVEHKA